MENQENTGVKITRRTKDVRWQRKTRRLKKKDFVQGTLTKKKTKISKPKKEKSSRKKKKGFSGGASGGRKDDRKRVHL